MRKYVFVAWASVIILGTILVPTITANENINIGENSQETQRLWIIGTIKDYGDDYFNVISFVGVHGFYISSGWKGFNMGPINEKPFRIYNSSFKGILSDTLIIGTAIEQSGPF